LTDAIERLALDISNAPNFTFAHLVSARAAAGLAAVAPPDTGRRPKTWRRDAEMSVLTLT